MKIKMTKKNTIIVVLFIVLLTSCATIGTDFNGKNVYKIEIGVTLKSDIKKILGDPWRVGIDNGNTAWTYGYYHFKIFKGLETKDLYIVFDSDGKVRSYTYNKSDFKK